jgi:hypothetical protein
MTDEYENEDCPDGGSKLLRNISQIIPDYKT